MRTNALCLKAATRLYRLLAPFLLAFLAVLPMALAVDPPPDGGYSGENTAEGENALFSLSLGADNTAIGFESLFSTTIGEQDTALGALSLHLNTTGSANTAVGYNALASNTTGSLNTAVGLEALGSNTTAGDSTAVGSYALAANTGATGNTGLGAFALGANSHGVSNTATGYGALGGNRTGNFNTAMGLSALAFNKSGDNNTAIGLTALFNNTGGNNIALGTGAGINLTTGANNIDIGNPGVADESNTIRIGTDGLQTATYIAGIQGVGLAVAAAVGVTPDGQLGVRASSARYKQDIRPMAKTSEAIFSLNPVTFRYKKNLDPKGSPQFGLVAEEVAKVDPDLVVPDAKGKPLTVRYDEVNAMLLNEFLKEHRKVEEQGATMAELRAALKQQEKQITTLTSQMQRVSDQLQASGAKLQMVAEINKP